MKIKVTESQLKKLNESTKVERFIDHVVNTLKKPYFKNLWKLDIKEEAIQEHILSRVLGQPVVIMEQKDHMSLYDEGLNDEIYFEFNRPDGSNFWQYSEYNEDGECIYTIQGDSDEGEEVVRDERPNVNESRDKQGRFIEFVLKDLTDKIEVIDDKEVSLPWKSPYKNGYYPIDDFFHTNKRNRIFFDFKDYLNKHYHVPKDNIHHLWDEFFFKVRIKVSMFKRRRMNESDDKLVNFVVKDLFNRSKFVLRDEREYGLGIFHEGSFPFEDHYNEEDLTWSALNLLHMFDADNIFDDNRYKTLHHTEYDFISYLKETYGITDMRNVRFIWKGYIESMFDKISELDEGLNT
jgi:hypothetical protein